MVSNRDLEDYQAFKSRDDSAINNFFKRSSPEAVVGLIGLILVGYYFISKTKVNPYIIFGGIIIIIGLIIFKMNQAKELPDIPLETIRILAVSVVERSIGFVYSNGTRVQPGEYARMIYEGEYGMPYTSWKWEVGVVIFKPNGLKEEKRVLMHPKTGFCTGINPAYSGFTGLEASSKDRKIIIPTNEFNVEKREIKKW